MELKTLFKIALMFSACFLGVSLLLVHEFAVGFLSPRAMGTALLLLCLCIAGGSIFVLTIAKAQRRSGDQPEKPLGDAVRKRRLLQIKLGKIAIVILVFALLSGLLKLRNGPIWPLLVGITMNILITFAIARAVMQLQTSLKDDTRPDHS
jgi:uncharacterized membrane protein YqhA